MVAVQGGFHKWSVVDVTTVLGRDARTVPDGYALVVEVEQGLGGVVRDEVVVPWEIERGISNVDLSGGLEGGATRDLEGAVPVGRGLEMWPVG